MDVRRGLHDCANRTLISHSTCPANTLTHQLMQMPCSDEPAPANQIRASKLFKGYTLTIKSLSLLVEKHKGFRNRLGKHSSTCLALLYRSLAQNGAMMGRIPLESDLYHARTLASLGSLCVCLSVYLSQVTLNSEHNLCLRDCEVATCLRADSRGGWPGMSTRTHTMLNSPELVKWITASIPRLLFMLQDSLPSHWSARRRQISRLGVFIFACELFPCKVCLDPRDQGCLLPFGRERRGGHSP